MIYPNLKNVSFRFLSLHFVLIVQRGWDDPESILMYKRKAIKVMKTTIMAHNFIIVQIASLQEGYCFTDPT